MNGILDVKREIVQRLNEAVKQAQAEGKLPAVNLPEIAIEHPQNPAHGDYASNIAMKLARMAGKNPLLIAKDLLPYISSTPEIEKVNAVPPGFINFTISKEWLSRQTDNIVASGDNYGSLDLGKNARVQIEFVSANPTGPLHVGNGRGAILGSTLAAVLKFAGYYVEKEYYINDAGAQVNAFYNSLYARYKQQFGMAAELPENGYMGSYMVDLAKEIIAEKGDTFLKMSDPDAAAAIGKTGLPRMLEIIKTDLAALGVTYDVWFSEKSLYEKNGNLFNHVMSLLKESGYISQKEGATWFVSTALGEDKDNVVIRGDGTPTYFASDIAYHYNKFVETSIRQSHRYLGSRPSGPCFEDEGRGERAADQP